jgi:hypothetical protein
MPNAYFDEGQRLLQEGDWVGAIQSLGWAKDVEPDSVPVFLTLIAAYESAAAAEEEPDLLQQAFNVCRDLRDRRLPMSHDEQAGFYATFVRVRDKVIAARAAGWTPPPPKERVQDALRPPRSTS